VSEEYILEALKETNKKIADLKEFNVPVILQTIEEYKKAGADQHFMEQQEAQLQKIYALIEQLEAKKIRLFNRL
jgi:transposase